MRASGLVAAISHGVVLAILTRYKFTTRGKAVSRVRNDGRLGHGADR